MAVVLYADGGVIGRNPSPYGGPYAWYLIQDNETVIRAGDGILTPADLGTETVSNNNTELLAVLAGAEAATPNYPNLTIKSDSLNALRWLFGEKGIQNVPQALRDRLIAYLKTGRLAGCSYTLLAGHPTKEWLAAGYRTEPGKSPLEVSIWNKACDDRCNELKRLWEVEHGLRAPAAPKPPSDRRVSMQLRKLPPGTSLGHYPAHATEAECNARLAARLADLEQNGVPCPECGQVMMDTGKAFLCGFPGCGAPAAPAFLDGSGLPEPGLMEGFQQVSLWEDGTHA